MQPRQGALGNLSSRTRETDTVGRSPPTGSPVGAEQEQVLGYGSVATSSWFLACLPQHTARSTAFSLYSAPRSTQELLLVLRMMCSQWLHRSLILTVTLCCSGHVCRSWKLVVQAGMLLAADRFEAGDGSIRVIRGLSDSLFPASSQEPMKMLSV